MKRSGVVGAGIVLVCAVLLLTGCTGISQPRATVTVTAPPPVADTPAGPPAPTSIADAPLCSSLVGKPTAQAVDPTGGAHCVFSVGVNGANVIKTNCDPVGNAGATVWGWFNPDATNGDQTVYAGKDGGTIVIAASSGGATTIIASYLAAVGC